MDMVVDGEDVGLNPVSVISCIKPECIRFLAHHFPQRKLVLSVRPQRHMV